VLYSLAVALYVIVCLFLVVVVLLQPGQVGRRGGGCGVFGAGSSTGSVFGGRGASTVLSKATTIAAASFMVLSIVLARAGSDRSAVEGAAQSVLTPKAAPAGKPAEKAPEKAGDAPAPAAPAPAAPAPAPAAPAAPAPAAP